MADVISAESFLAQTAYSDSRPHLAPAIARLMEEYAQLRTAALEAENARLKLQSEHADCWWNDDEKFESAEQCAEESGLKVGDEFTLQAAAYWPEKYKVLAVRNQETDEGDYDCEQISKRREEFPRWFEMKADRDALRAQVKRLTAPVTREEIGIDVDNAWWFEDRFDVIIAARAKEQPKAQ